MSAKQYALLIQSFGQNYQLDHELLLEKQKRGEDMFTLFRNKIKKWAVQKAAEDYSTAIFECMDLSVEQKNVPEIENRLKEIPEFKTRLPIIVGFDADGFNHEDLDKSPAPSQLWIAAIQTLEESGFKVDKMYSQIYNYGLTQKDFDILNSSTMFGDEIPASFSMESVKPILYTNPDVTNSKLESDLSKMGLGHISPKDVHRPDFGAWTGDYGGSPKKPKSQEDEIKLAGSLFGWDKFLKANPNVEATSCFVWCNLAAGIASKMDIPDRGIEDAHVCTSSLRMIQDGKFGVPGKIKTMFVGDANIYQAIQAWKNFEIVRAFRIWREMFNRSN